MPTREEFSTLIERYIAGLDFGGEPTDLYEPIKFSLDQGGKRLRPLIVMMANDLFSDDVNGALPCATAIEIFHNFTLLHDDIMDNADVRRGKPAVHKKWSANTAILSGDAMMIYAYTLLEKCPERVLGRIFAEFNRMAMEVCEGQQYDMDFESREQVALDEYLKMIGLKTAALLGRAAKIGAIVGGASESDCNKLYEFCIELGIAFQIQDDLLDTYGDDKTLGKRVGGDIIEAKKTFLTINAMQQADPVIREKLTATLNNKQIDSAQKIEEVRSIYDLLNVRDIAQKAVVERMQRAIDSLESVSVERARLAPLKELAMGLINRQK